MQATLSQRGARNWVLVAGLLLIVCALIATISLTIEASEDETLEGDVTVATTVQSIHEPGVTDLVGFMNWAGEALPMTALTLLVAGALASHRRYAEMLVVIPTLLAHPVNWLLKQLAESPRPTSNYVRVTDPSQGFGFPSGHTMAIVVFFGVVAYLATTQLRQRPGRLVVQVVAIAAILAIGFSRIYSGAHWPSDVLGAYLWGGFCVAGLALAHRALSRRLAPLPLVLSAEC